MTAKIDQIVRHPIKSHGREFVDNVELTAGKSMPWDRVWAVAHDASDAPGDAWAPSRHFSRVAKAPNLMAISATVDERTEIVTLNHPERGEISIHPERDSSAFLEWAGPLVPAGRAQSARVMRAPDRGMSDTDYPSISIGSLQSLATLQDKMGQEMTPDRFRMNFWIDGLSAWEEFDWIGKRVKMGDAVLEIREPTIRCRATMANPDTGELDANTLDALFDGWGHRNFGIYAVVVSGGQVRVNDDVALIQ